jgi:type IV secretory pathway TrbD component
MAAGDRRRNKTFKTMNRPLTVLGAERRLFFVALISGGAVFSLMHSLVGGIVLFIVGTIVARKATKYDVEILRVLMNSTKFRTRYDPMKEQPAQIRIMRLPCLLSYGGVLVRMATVSRGDRFAVRGELPSRRTRRVGGVCCPPAHTPRSSGSTSGRTTASPRPSLLSQRRPQGDTLPHAAQPW